MLCPGTVRAQIPGMADIHFCGPDDQPLCRGTAGDSWLWTAVEHAVTCSGCALVMRLQHEAASAELAEDGAPGYAPKAAGDPVRLGIDCGGGTA